MLKNGTIAALCSILLLAASAEAGIIVDFGGNGGVAPFDVEIADVDTAPVLTETPDTGSFNDPAVVGSLSNATGSVNWSMATFADGSTGKNVARNETRGWGVASSVPGNHIANDARLGFVFDLSSLTVDAGYILQITGFTTVTVDPVTGSAPATSGVDVDASGLMAYSPDSSTSLGGDDDVEHTFTSAIDLADGTLVEFTGDFENRWRVSSIELSTVVPEPATMGLLAVGGLALLRRRRRS